MPGCRALTDSEIEQFKSKFIRQRDRCFFVLANRTGLRLSELLSIKIGQVYKFGKVTESLYLPKASVKGKKSSAEIVLHLEAKKEIEALLNSFENIDSAAPLFQSKKGGTLKRWQAWNILKTIANELELSGKIAGHSTRKTFAWQLYKKSGHDLRTTQKALRHRFITTTVQYLDPDQKDVDNLILNL
jgi:site-specific recombinase XerD